MGLAVEDSQGVPGAAWGVAADSIVGFGSGSGSGSGFESGSGLGVMIFRMAVESSVALW